MRELTSQELTNVTGGADKQQPAAAAAAAPADAAQQQQAAAPQAAPFDFMQFMSGIGNLGQVAASIIQAIAQLKGVGGDNALKYAQARAIDRGQQTAQA